MTPATAEHIDVALADAVATITAALDRMARKGQPGGDTAQLGAVATGATQPVLALAAAAHFAAHLADALATATGTTGEAVLQRLALRIAAGNTSPTGPLDRSDRP